VPALRERGEDILLLAGRILEKLGSSVDALDEDARSALQNYSYPGNVRELENLLERAVTLCSDGKVRERDLSLRSPASKDDGHTPAGATDLGNQIESVQRQAIVEALEKARYNKTAAAKLLGLTFRQLRYRIKKLGIE